MSSLNPSPRSEPRSSSKELVCLLGAFSLGVFAQQTQQPLLATAISVLSLAALLGLRVVARYRRIDARRLESRHSVRSLESRLDRHVSQIPRPHIRRQPLRRPSMDRQYLPVVTSGNRNR
jgi:hypothetical protein